MFVVFQSTSKLPPPPVLTQEVSWSRSAARSAPGESQCPGKSHVYLMQAPPLPPDSGSCLNKALFNWWTISDVQLLNAGQSRYYNSMRTNLWIVQDRVRGKWSRLSTWLRYCLLGGLMVHSELLLPCSSATVTSSRVYASRNCKALWETQATESLQECNCRSNAKTANTPVNTAYTTANSNSKLLKAHLCSTLNVDTDLLEV